jgi:uptake hydrogenase large subunit
MASKKRITIPANRVEGDLEIRVEIEDGRVSDAFSMGIMFRGIENLMKGRAPLDSLVITPRVCGICTTSHLHAAAKALDVIYGVDVPDAAQRVRDVASMVEMLQNDMRHTFHMFMPDIAHPAYAGHSLHEEAVSRYQPLEGTAVIEAVRETNKILEIIAILGGQWPHSSFMVPGGVASVIDANDIAQCRYLLSHFRKWYETRILGCSIERWQAVSGEADLDVWLTENDSQRESELGFFIRFMREAGLEGLGRGCGNYVCFGFPGGEAAHGFSAGFMNAGGRRPLDQAMIAEDVSHSWLKGIGAKHPFEGKTAPLGKDAAGDRYSWAKAPRYNGEPAETGPLADALVAGRPLYHDLIGAYGPSAFVRQFARITRASRLIPLIEQFLEDISNERPVFFNNHPMVPKNEEGFGFIEAPRGLLGHWVRIEDNAISNYQIITPTAWNASPRDAVGQRGPLETALIDTPVKDEREMVGIYHVIRSFDPCLVCCVHTVVV